MTDGYKKKRIIETKKLSKSEYLEKGKKRYRFFLPLLEPMTGEEKELPIKPYSLGAWLGDGTNKKPRITICNTDTAIRDRVVSDGYKEIHCYKQAGCSGYEFADLREDLQKEGMCYSRIIAEKHIPEIYFTATEAQRLELLAGIIDTDGTLKDNNRYAITTISERLKNDIVKLVSTFGWRVCVTEYVKEQACGTYGLNHDLYCISFNATLEIPCVVDRKKLNVFAKQRRIAITGIDHIPAKSGNCISVEGGIYRVGERLKPTHNSTICIYFLAWVIGRHPESHNAMSGHSGILADRFYNDVKKLTTDEEYTFGEIFPDVKLLDKSGDKNELFYSKESFATLTARGIDGTWTGAVDISSDGYLYVDDMIRDRAESLSPMRLNKRYQDYLNVLVDRKNDGSKELMVGTRWNCFDILGILKSENHDNPLYRFREIPALNDDDTSNFEYDYGKGFSTQHYIEMRNRLDKNEWMAKFQQKPFVREGLLFPEDELNYFNGVVPDVEYSVYAAIDCAFGGGDSLSMPIAKIIGDEVYVIDWVFSNKDKFITRPLVVGATTRNEIQRIQIEANAGGTEYAEDIEKMLHDEGYSINITTPRANNKQSKADKIIQYSADIRKNFYFLQPKLQNDMYRKAMEELCTYVEVGKNMHDDAADSLTQLYQMIYKSKKKQTIIIKSPI